MEIDFSELSANQRYHVMTQVVIPRPIAWVLTDNGDNKSYNLAPFSYFNVVCSEPPLVILSMGKKPDGEIKDTRRNIIERKQLVIHIPQDTEAHNVTASAATLPHGESEVSQLNLELVEEDDWLLPRLKDAKVAMACEYYDLKEIGPNQQAIFFCEVKKIFVDDQVTTQDEKGRLSIDAKGIAPLSRLGANQYANFGDVFTVVRPK